MTKSLTMQNEDIPTQKGEPAIQADGKRGGLEARLMIIGIAVIAVFATLAVYFVR